MYVKHTTLLDVPLDAILDLLVLALHHLQVLLHVLESLECEELLLGHGVDDLEDDLPHPRLEVEPVHLELH